MSFSTGLRITELDDFITPAQECIKPVKLDNSNKKTSKIIIGEDGSYTGIRENGDKYNMEKVNITINDCLACSGCVTTAETILINEHSNEEFFKKIRFLKENYDNTLVVVSISPQSKASLSAKFNLGNAVETHKKLKLFFQTLSVDAVLDTTFGREFSLLETANETKEKIQLNIKNSPTISSSCPGWVCYAEKHKNNDLIVPLISRAKSPQQIMGYLVKQFLPANDNRYQATKIFHVSIMPCFDKKLEATRNEFVFTNSRTGEREKDVDLVLSTMEIEQIITERQYDFRTECNTEDNEIENIFTDISQDTLPFREGGNLTMFSLNDNNKVNKFYTHEGSGSGGYLEFTFRYCAKQLYDIDLHTNLSEDPRVKYKTFRNSDFQEVSLISESDEHVEPLLTFASAYGFRNIQTIVQRVRLKKCNYQFIEIMACPKGCLNGGGQIRTEHKEEQKDLFEKVTNVYKSTVIQLPLVNKTAKSIYDRINDKNCLRTSYNIIPKLEFINPSSLRW